MINLTLHETTNSNELVWPDDERKVDGESSSLEVFTDFKKVIPLVIDAETSAIDAEKLMLKSHVRLKIVVNSDGGFLGVVSLQELNSQELIKKISLGANRDDLLVADFMKPKDQLKAFDYSELKKTTINELVHALQQNGQQHCLVLDDDKKIRGIISTSDIARRLRLPINITHDSSFVAIYNAIH